MTCPPVVITASERLVEHFRKELWFPRLLDRKYYQAWLDAGATGTEDRCRAETKRILAEHEAEPVAADLDRALTEIVESARRHLA